MEYFLWPLWEYFVAPIANQGVCLQDHIHAGKNNSEDKKYVSNVWEGKMKT